MNYLGARTRRRQTRRDRIFSDHQARGERLEREGKEKFQALEPVLGPLARTILDVVQALPEEQRVRFVEYTLGTLTLNAMENGSDPEKFGGMVLTGIDTPRPGIVVCTRSHAGDAITRDALAHIQRDQMSPPPNSPGVIK